MRSRPSKKHRALKAIDRADRASGREIGARSERTRKKSPSAIVFPFVQETAAAGTPSLARTTPRALALVAFVLIAWLAIQTVAAIPAMLWVAYLALSNDPTLGPRDTRAIFE